MGAEFALEKTLTKETNGRLIKSTLDLDYLDCSTYDLDTVERLFLDTTLAKAHPRESYGAQVPHRYFKSPSTRAFHYVITPGYCRVTTEQLSHGTGFNGFAQEEVDITLRKEKLEEKTRDAKRRRRQRLRQAEAQAEHCLLYTSPSPRDATLSRMPSSA